MSWRPTICHPNWPINEPFRVLAMRGKNGIGVIYGKIFEAQYPPMRTGKTIYCILVTPKSQDLTVRQ